jgi:hypothetical protein
VTLLPDSDDDGDTESTFGELFHRHKGQRLALDVAFVCDDVLHRWSQDAPWRDDYDAARDARQELLEDERAKEQWQELGSRITEWAQQCSVDANFRRAAWPSRATRVRKLLPYGMPTEIIHE